MAGNDDPFAPISPAPIEGGTYTLEVTGLTTKQLETLIKAVWDLKDERGLLCMVDHAWRLEKS